LPITPPATPPAVAPMIAPSCLRLSDAHAATPAAIITPSAMRRRGALTTACMVNME
jgi:hypothetical protein